MGTRIQMIDIVVVYKVKTPGTLCNNVSPNVKQNHSYLASSRPLKSESLGMGLSLRIFCQTSLGILMSILGWGPKTHKVSTWASDGDFSLLSFWDHDWWPFLGESSTRNRHSLQLTGMLCWVTYFFRAGSCRAKGFSLQTRRWLLQQSCLWTFTRGSRK